MVLSRIQPGFSHSMLRLCQRLPNVVVSSEASRNNTFSMSVPSQHIQTSSFSQIQVTTRTFCKVTDSRVAEVYLEDVFETGVGEEDPLEELRNYLYPDIDDPIIGDLSNAASAQEVFDVLEEIGDSASKHHTTQAVSTLYHLQKVAGHVVNCVDEDENNIARVEFNRLLNANEQFKTLVDRLRTQIKDIDFGILAYIFMCLRRMERPLHDRIMQEISIHLKRNLNQLDLTALSYFSVAIRGRNVNASQIRDTPLTWIITLAPAVPKLRSHLESCSTPDDVRKLAICMNAMCRIISDEFMDDFACKVSELIDKGCFEDPKHLGSLCKVLSLALSKRDWFLDQAEFSRKVLLQFKDRTHLLRPIQALMVSKICLDSVSPVSIFYEIDETIGKMYEEAKNMKEIVPRVDFLHSMVTSRIKYMDPDVVRGIVETSIDSPTFPIHISQLFGIIRNVTITDQDLIDKFLMKSFESCRNSVTDLQRLAIRYPNFNSTICGLKRCQQFEDEMCDIFAKDMVTTPYTGRFAAQLGFLLAYGNTVPEAAVQRLESMIAQMNPFSVYIVSRGMETRLEWTSPRERSGSKMLQLVDTIEVHLGSRVLQLLDEPADFPSLFLLFRSVVSRRKYIEPTVLTETISRLLQCMEESPLSFSVIRKISASMFSVKPVYGLPNILDHFINYVIENRNHIHIHSVYRPLMFCFQANHDVRNRNFLDICASCTERDFDCLLGIEVIDIALALVRYNNLPLSLARKIFSTEFMDKLDNELQMSLKTKAGYASRVRLKMMALNRAVCLDFPEYKIPWFHDRYCQEHANQLVNMRSPNWARGIREEVYESLCETVGGEKYVREAVLSPYYNVIDFELVFDSHGKPLPIAEIAQDRLRAIRRSMDVSGLVGGARYHKVAVIVGTNNSYTADTRKLVGLEEMMRRHLVAQGYQVINISPHDWNSMQMSEKTARQKYFKENIAVGV